MPRGRPPNLDRRRRIIELRAAGWTYQEIGARLGVSRQSVQQTLPPTDKARFVPIRCRECAAIITRLRTVHNNNGLVYCADCLPPDALFGQKLRAYRVAAQLTQAELAARIGVPSTTIHSWERSQRRPRQPTVAALAAVLGIPQ